MGSECKSFENLYVSKGILVDVLLHFGLLDEVTFEKLKAFSFKSTMSVKDVHNLLNHSKRYATLEFAEDVFAQSEPGSLINNN